MPRGYRLQIDDILTAIARIGACVQGTSWGLPRHGGAGVGLRHCRAEPINGWGPGTLATMPESVRILGDCDDCQGNGNLKLRDRLSRVDTRFLTGISGTPDR